MKFLVIALVSMTASFAIADDYACTLTVKGESAEAVAPYKINSAQVELQGFKCLGDITDGVAKTVLFSPEEIDGNSQVMNQSRKGFAEVSLSEMGAHCLCGVR